MPFEDSLLDAILDGLQHQRGRLVDVGARGGAADARHLAEAGPSGRVPVAQPWD